MHGCVYVCMCVCMCVHHVGAIISTECILFFSYKCHMILQHWFSSKQLEYTIVIIIAAEKPKCRDSLTLLKELEISSWSFLGHASEIYVLPDDHDHIHSMVVQELISGNMLTCQFLTWLGSMGNVWVWTQYSSCFFM